MVSGNVVVSANAIANLGRYTELESKGYATPQLSDTQKAQVAQLQSAIKADAALIEQAEVQLSYTRLTSPMLGFGRLPITGVGLLRSASGNAWFTRSRPVSLWALLPTYAASSSQLLANSR